MRLLHKLIPDFLRAWDEDLQRTHPRLWSTRFHMHLWFLLLVVLLVFLLGLVLPVDIRQFPNPAEMFTYMLVPATVYFAFWVYKVVLFSVNKRFGQRSAVGEIGEFLVLLVSVFLIWTIPFTLACTVNWRASNQVSDEALTAQIDHLNLNAHAFIDPDVYYSYQYDHEYTSDYTSGHRQMGSHVFFRSLEEYQARHQRKHDDEQPLGGIYSGWEDRYNELSNPRMPKYDPAAAAFYRASMDSIEQNFPYYFVAHGSYKPDYNRSLSGERILPILKDSILEWHYVEHVKANSPLDHTAIEEALRIARSYTDKVLVKAPADVESDLRERKPTDTRIHWSKEQINRISRAKAWSYFFTREDAFLPVMIILAFGLTMLTSIFKSVYWQPYLIAFVTAGVTPILVMILGMIISRDMFGVNEGDFFVRTHYLILVAMILATVLIPRLTAYRTILAVTTILASVAVPFIAVFTLHLLHEIHDIFGLAALEGVRHEGDWHELSVEIQDAHHVEVQQLSATVTLWYFWTLWAGIALYMLVLHPVFTGLFARLMALPERK